MVRYYGWCSNKTRGQRGRKKAATGQVEEGKAISYQFAVGRSGKIMSSCPIGTNADIIDTFWAESHPVISNRCGKRVDGK